MTGDDIHESGGNDGDDDSRDCAGKGGDDGANDDNNVNFDNVCRCKRYNVLGKRHLLV